METDPSHGAISRSELLRGVIAERLTTAAREILAVVERTVADYEEEASGFRQELDRQRRQLELLQPEVKMEAPDDQQLFSLCEAGGHQEAEEHQKQNDYELRVENCWSLRFINQPGERMEEEEERKGEGEQCLTETEHEAPRFAPLRSESNGTTAAAKRFRIGDPQNLVDLRIRILEDPNVTVLSKVVFQKYPLHELQVPRSLRQSEFVNLLRSSFPQLQSTKCFDVCITDKSRRLIPLRLKTLTPPHVEKAAGNSALYLRLQPFYEESASVSKNRSKRPNTTVPSRKRKRPRMKQPVSHVDLNLRFLDDSNVNTLSPHAFRRFPLQELRCPSGLRESDFVDLLRSNFPQLKNGENFEFLNSNRNRKLQLLKLETLTPEEIYKVTHLSKISTLFVRVKPPEDVQTSQKKDIQTLPKKDIQMNSKKEFKASSKKELKASLKKELKASSKKEFKASSKMEFKASSKKNIQRNPKTDAHRNLKKNARKHLKKDVRISLTNVVQMSVKKPHIIQRGVDSDGVSSSLQEQTTLCMSNPTQQASINFHNPTLPHKNDDSTRTDAAPDSVLSLESPTVEHDEDKNRKLNGITEHHINEELETAQLDKEDPLTHNGSSTSFVCKICRMLRGSRKMLIKHAWRHVDAPEQMCGVCGERCESADELRNHLQTHQRTHRCDICGKSFLSIAGLQGHIARHTGKTPYKCDICGKAFIMMSLLRNHLAKVHRKDVSKLLLKTVKKQHPWHTEQKMKVGPQHSRTHPHRGETVPVHPLRKGLHPGVECEETPANPQEERNAAR
ncbi:uncharacterized protein KZ484_011522 [Pholidichthys leucotaenia]